MNKAIRFPLRKNVFPSNRHIHNTHSFQLSRHLPPKDIRPIEVVQTAHAPRVYLPHIRYAGPTLYGVILSTGTFITAATMYDRNQQTLWDRLRSHSITQWFSDGGDKLRARLWKEKKDLLIEKRQHYLERWAAWLNSLSIPLDIKRAAWIMGEKLTSLTEAEKTLAGLIGINTLVFACWQIPRLAPFMSKWFMHLPGGRRNITLLTSCFSHQEFFHFTFNMVGLWSFGQFVHDYVGREQFLAMYLSSGIMANVVSHNMSLFLRNSRPLLPGLGASGAVYGLLAATAVIQPSASISLIFLPMVPIQLSAALPVIMGFDIAGILLKWRRFDHFAHLAGASAGIGYMVFGQQYIWGPLVKKVHELRNSK